jgi:hypothetical protein
MAVTQQDIDNLNTAIAAGERQVSIGGQSVTYQTVASLIHARNDMRTELARATATTPRKSTVLLQYGGRDFSTPRDC